MSRGGRGGRGGSSTAPGRGGRQELLRNTADDLDLDQTALKDAGQEPPPLYPEMEIPDPPVLSLEDVYRVRKMRELTYRIQRSPFYIVPEKKVNDVIRWGDRHSPQNIAGKDMLGNCLTDYPDNSLLPSELLAGKKVGLRKSFLPCSTLDMAQPKTTESRTEEDAKRLHALELKEIRAREGDAKDDDDGDSLQERGPSDYDEDEDDYNRDYYDSGVESGGEDAEPIF
jgi:hypothetical protein